MNIRPKEQDMPTFFITAEQFARLETILEREPRAREDMPLLNKLMNEPSIFDN